MVWTTAGTQRVCSKCLILKEKVVGYTDESGITLPPLHPRCHCTIMYREVEEPKPKELPSFAPQRVDNEKIRLNINGFGEAYIPLAKLTKYALNPDKAVAFDKALGYNMEIEMFDKILLKTGETAYIVEIYEQGVAYEADIDKADGSIETETIKHADIEKVLKRPKTFSD